MLARKLALTNALGALAIAAPALAERPAGFELQETFVLGIVEYDLDGYTELTGWRIAPSWYVGRENGEDDALSLIWQGTRQQVSISTEGLRFTRRF